MHIAQLHFAHAGQAEREIQIPLADLGESIRPLATPFDMVFLDQKNPKGAVERPLAVAVEPDAELVMDAEVSEELMDVGSISGPELVELSRNMPEFAEDMLEITDVAQRVINASKQGDTTPDESLPDRSLDLPDAAVMRTEPDHMPIGNLKDTARVRQTVLPEIPDAVEGVPQKHADMKAPRAVVDVETDAPAAELAVPVDQVLNAPREQNAPIVVSSVSTALPRIAPSLGARTVREVFPVQRHFMSGHNFQSERASEPGGAVPVLDSRPVIDRPRQVLERPAEQSDVSQGKTAVLPRPSELQIAGTHASIPGVPPTQQQNSPKSKAEERVSDIPAPSPALEMGAKTVPAPDVAKPTPLAWAAAPLIYTVEQEAGRPIPDDMGFRVVEHVSSPAGDLKSVAHTRGTEVPRMVTAQIAEIVRQQPERPVELTLSPEELGRLRMSFQSEGSAMHVILSFERPDTLELMRRHIDQLAQDMRALGMSDVSFTFQQQTSEGGGGTYSEGGSARSSPDPQSDQQSMPEDLTSRVLNIAGRAGVDIRV